VTKFPGWEAVSKEKFIPVDLEIKEIQIRTISKINSGHKIDLRFFTSDSGNGNIFIYFQEPMMYHLGWCTKDFSKDRFDRAPTITKQTIWRIMKDQKTKLLIWCNDVLVLTYTFKDSLRTSDCVRTYGQDTTRMKFTNADTASKEYRILEGMPSIKILRIQQIKSRI
jgi:hypothetical protein